MRFVAALLLALFPIRPAMAEAPRVVTDIAPIHSLVAQVMDGVGEPDLLIPAQVSPHGLSLKPSQARQLSKADIVFWIGPTLTPWMERAVETLAADARVVELIEAVGLTLLHAEGDEPHGTDHADEHEAERADPHIWLDTANALILVLHVAEVLAEHDTANAQTYYRNAEEASRRISGLALSLAEAMRPAKDKPYIVYHDAYRYFENRFGLGRAVAIAGGHGSKPGARRISEIRSAIRRSKARCVFAEVQFDPRGVTAVLRGTDARRAILDPMGQTAQPGPDLYEAVLRGLARSMIDCLR